MIKTTHIDLAINTTEALITIVDSFRFIYIKSSDFLDIEFYNDSTYDIVDEIEINEDILNQRDLERIALNWIFKNVEIVDDVNFKNGICQI